MRLPAHLREAPQAGFGIIEVLVSAILVAMISTGVFVTFDAANSASGNNRARSVASNIARSDQERLRGMTAQELANLQPTSSKEVDGRTYDIASSTQWVADRTGEPSCTSADGRADYLRLRSSVTWPDMKGLNPVVVESLRAIPRGAFRPNQGSIAVKVINRNGAPVPGATVSITGGQGYSGVTNAQGCLLLDQVPAGSYTANISKAGLVSDAYPNNAIYTKDFTVAKEQTSSISTALDTAGTARVSFRTTSTVCTTTCTEAGTTGEAFTIANAGLINPRQINYKLAAATAANANLYTGAAGTALTSNTTRAVFPFTSAYKVWSGACDEANPAKYGQPEVSQTVPAGALTPATPTAAFYVREPRLEISFQKASGNLNRSRMVIKPAVAGCARTIVVENSSTTTPTHSTAQTLPYGDYTVCVQETLGSPSGTGATSGANSQNVLRTTFNVQNRVANGTAWPAVTLPTTTSSGSCPAS